jgi:dipeptidase D
VEVHGLQGGHSGGDINKNRGNANKIIGRALGKILAEIPIQLTALKGGTVRNAIPREAEAILALPAVDVEKCRELIAKFEAVVKKEYARTEPVLKLSLSEATGRSPAVSAADSRRIIQLLMALPNGVSSMSTEMEGLVETSNNIGIMELTYEGFRIVSSNRSAVASRLEEIVMRVEALGLLAGAGAQRTTPTAPWEPDRDAALLKKCIQVYQACFGEQPQVQATHGGLECGLLNARCGPLEAISMGPTIVNAHSPDETLHIPSVGRMREFLAALLKDS